MNIKYTESHEMDGGFALGPVARAAGQLASKVSGPYSDLKRAGQAFALPDAEPLQAIDDTLGQGLRELGAFDTRDTWLAAAKTRIAKGLVVPHWFDRDYNREWLSEVGVQSDLKTLARARVLGHSPDVDVLRRVQDRYCAFSGEAQPFAESAVKSVVAYLVCRAMPPSAGPVPAMLQAHSAAMHDQFQRLERQRLTGSGSHTAEVVGVVDENLRGRLAGVLRRRTGMAGERTANELNSLYAATGDSGSLAVASRPAKIEVMNWVVRAAAAADRIDQARSMVELMQNDGIQPDVVALAAFESAQGNHDAALRALRDVDSADARSMMFVVLCKAHGDAVAVEQIPASDSFDAKRFTPVGWRNVCACLMRLGHMQRACDLSDALPSSVTDECAELLEVLGVAWVSELLPHARHADLLEGHPTMLAHGRLDTPRARIATQRAAGLFDRAAAVATAHSSSATARRCRDWLVALRLSDPDARTAEMARLREAMADAEQAVDLVGFVGAFRLDVDLAPLERHLVRRRLLGGWDERERAAWLCVLEQGNRDDELISFIEDEWHTLGRSHDRAALAQLLVAALLRGGRAARAQEWLSGHADEIDGQDVARLDLMISARRGDDPTMRARALYEQTHALVDLHNLVSSLLQANQWTELVPYARQLFDEELTHQNLGVCLHAMAKARSTLAEQLDFLETARIKVDFTSDLDAQTALTLLGLGRAREAQVILRRLEAERDDPRDLAMDFNLSVQVGAWHRFPSLVERGLKHRSVLTPASLLSVARIAGLHSANHAIELASEAVRRRPDDIAVLMSAYQLAITVGKDEVGRLWFQRALSLPRDDKLLRPVSPREFLSMQEEDWKTRPDKLEMLRTATIPLHMATSLFNAPLTRFLLVVPRINRDQVDARQRVCIPVRSGARLPVPCIDAKSISLDASSVLMLVDLGLLEAVLESFSSVWVSPRLLGMLLEDRKHLSFHQPSRVRAAKPLHQLVALGKLKVVRERGPADLAKVIGAPDAAMLVQAEHVGGLLVHPGALLDLEHYLERPAQLGGRERFVVCLHDISHALRVGGHITAAQEAVANAHFSTVDAPGRTVPNDRAPLPLTHLFLDPQAALALHQTSLLPILLGAGATLYVHEAVATEWDELVETDFANEPTISAVEACRTALFVAWEAGKLHLLAPTKDEEDEPFSSAMACLMDMLHEAGEADVACIDDRMVNVHPTMTGKSGRVVPIVTTFDLIDRLAHEGALSNGQRLETLHEVRRRQMHCAPLTETDLQAMLAEALVDEDGTLRETAMLRTLREHIAMLHGGDVLCTAGDQTYLDALWLCGTRVVQALWEDLQVPPTAAAAKAQWVLRCVMPTVQDQMRHAPDRASQWKPLAVARASVGSLPWLRNEDRNAQKRRWIDAVQLGPFLPANGVVLDAVATNCAKLVLRHANDLVGAAVPLSEAQALQHIVALIPPLLRDRVLDDPQVVETAELIRGRATNLGSMDYRDVEEALRRLDGACNSVTVPNRDAGGPELTICQGDDGFMLTAGTGARAHLGALALLDHNASRRRAAFDRIIAAALPVFVQEDQWRALIDVRSLSPSEAVRFVDDLSDCAERRLEAIGQQLENETIKSEDIVPVGSSYYQSLIGTATPGQSASAFLHETFIPHVRSVMARSRDWGWRIARSAFVGPSFKIAEAMQDVPTDALLELLDRKGPERSLYVSVAELAIALERLPIHADFLPKIQERLARFDVASSAGARDDTTKLWASVHELTFRQISVHETTCAMPPWWRRLAAFVHAHLVTDVLDVSPEHRIPFAQWCDSQLDQRMAAACFLDHQQSPLHDVWGDFAGAADVKALGAAERLVSNARERGTLHIDWRPKGHEGEGQSEGTLAQLLGAAPDAMACSREGLSRPESPLDGVSVKIVITELADKEKNLAAWQLLSHASLAFRFDADLLSRLRTQAAADIGEITDALSATSVAARAALVASTQADPAMADEVVGSLMRRGKQLTTGEGAAFAWAVVLVAAAAQPDRDAWRMWLSRHLAHLAHSVPRGAPCAALVAPLLAADEMLGFDEQVAGQAIAIARAGAS